MENELNLEALLPIGTEQVRQAREVLNKYKTGKANLERKIIESEQWYKLRSWECMRREKNAGGAGDVEPVSGWLFNAIANKHADAMDNFPSPNVLPREASDKAEAESLSAILPVILQQNDFEEVYDLACDDKLKSGTGVYGIFWDPGRLGGMGDVVIRQEDVLSLFWQPGITDIQNSRHFFHVALVENEALEQSYPHLANRLGSSALDLSQYLYDDAVDTANMSAVVDWYYKKQVEGRTVLHYCKFVNDEVLFASENDPNYAVSGWYDHGLYPYVFDPLFRMKGTPCGFGYVDVAKSAQEYIDRGNQAILENLLANAAPRHFIREDGEVNEGEYADTRKKFVHVGGNLGRDSIIPIEGKPLSSIYVDVVNHKIDELKEVTGNRDISTGGTSSGVTAASAIAAMQEAGSKLSRNANRASYRAFRKLCLMVIELIRQFYDTPRCFRLLGEERFVAYSNAGLRPQQQTEVGMPVGQRLPLFDLEVTAQKQSPYSKLSQNELALQLYNAGLLNPQMADQALVCLEMMDFDRKEFLMNRIAKNGTLSQRLAALEQAMGIAAQAPGKPLGKLNIPLEGLKQESYITRNARKRVAESTAP